MHYWPGSPTDGCVWVLETPEGALVICVCFSVKCSIGFRSFPQDLSPTIKIHLIFITPKLLLRVPNSLSLRSLPSPPRLLSFCISSRASAAIVHLIDFPPSCLSHSLFLFQPGLLTLVQPYRFSFVSLSIFLCSPASLSPICLAAPSCLSMWGNIYFLTQVKHGLMFRNWPTERKSKL